MHFNAVPKRARALREAWVKKYFTFALLNDEFPLPLERNREERKISKLKRRTPHKASSYIKVKQSSTLQDGSALIPAPVRTTGSSSKASSSSSILPRNQLKASHKKGKYLGLELCARCGGGELPNCPQCDGTGYFKRYEGEVPSIITMGRNLDMSGQMSVPAFDYQPTSASDHEAVGRSDPLDANRGASGLRDGGQFGSMPLHDNFEE